MSALLPRTLAARFLLVVLMGAVVPMVIVGIWLTRTSARSGRDLLVGQLTSSADAVVTAISREWGTREGELQLLANNEAAVRLVRGDSSAVGPDTTYLAQLIGAMRANVASVTYAGRDGNTLWSTRTVAGVARSQSESRLPSTEVRVELPVPANGTREGMLRVGLRLEGIVPSNASVRRLVGNASLILADSAEAIWSEVPNPDSLLSPRTSDRWAVVRRALPVAGLRLLVLAPVAPYVDPFRTAARDGTVVLLAAAVVAMFVAAIMSRRLVSSLATLADAADRVSAGNLDSSVRVKGADEVARLGVAFNTMTESLRASVSELSRQRSLAAVGEFAASLSHDVRNSLTAVRVDLQHATRQLPHGEQSTALVRRALESVRRLDATVTSALKVARTGPETSTATVEDALEHAIESARPTFTEHGVSLNFEMPAGRTSVTGDAGALEQMFLNLLLNAAEAVDGGSVVQVHVQQLPQCVEVWISDDGVGISADLLLSIGQPLRTTKPQGTGLGLSIAKRIAEAHGGVLHIDSESSIGTTVTVTLPRREFVATE